MDQTETLVQVLLTKWREQERLHDEMATLIETLANDFNVTAPPAD